VTPKKRIRPKRDEEALPRGSLRVFRVGEGLPNLTMLRQELQDYTDVLLGRESPPRGTRGRTLSLMECADAYFARASEVKMQIQRLEAEGRVMRGSAHYKFRTGELQTFMDMARKASELGSRRLTEATLRMEAEKYGHETD
jgi:hypothetical protein